VKSTDRKTLTEFQRAIYLVNSIGRLADEELGARKVAMHMRFSTFSSSDSMTRHGVNLVLSIGACELAPGAPRLQGARPLGNRGMSLLGTKRTCRGGPTTSAVEGRTDMPFKRANFRLRP
jgi:hypothetical protein